VGESIEERLHPVWMLAFFYFVLQRENANESLPAYQESTSFFEACRFSFSFIRQMLELLKEKDSLPKGDPRIDKIDEELKEIYASASESERHVHYSKTYSFYFFGGDVTEKLNDYMKTAASNYSDMHDRYWAENLVDFYNLVKGKSEMDLKNQPGWQNSAFIYDGEVVSQDAVGNINFGYFGSYCNFPQSVLMAGAGVVQVTDGTSRLESWRTLFDDPRDTYRVFQGIEIYEEQN